MYQFIDNGTVTSAKGYYATGIHCGLKKRKKDVALIYSPTACTAAGTFTLNKVQAAPILVSKEIISKGTPVHAVLINSGNANACTGAQGHEDAIASQAYCAGLLSVPQASVLVSSTGVIGQLMPMHTFFSGIEQAVKTLRTDGGILAAKAIMTTDLQMKNFAVEVELTEGKVTIGGICKGSGMIMPNMATMLAFITTDAGIAQPLLQKMLVSAVNSSFNRISVDGDTSTNDMVILLANNAAGIAIEEGSESYNAFYSALEAVCKEMAKSIVVDGEGATKLVSISVHNAKTIADADDIARTIANSPLVKTAIHGCDANWGRILSAAGRSGVDFDPGKAKIYFDDLPILLEDYQIVLDEEKALAILQKDTMDIAIHINEGSCSTQWWTCDFSQDYIKINANYRT
ncbi:MAG: bifunctional glutamate N-acetyltransferase/amino-acid acetyltransferase ArgJ [Ignavibacteriales bacterium]|nr:bifunctional glutamate N-acetyltransferase/amino-acid acetyltransferase ArgJ [Ignavibacteriales bacterium]